MAVHPSGTGENWEEDVDVDQPHGLDYRYTNNVAKGVRLRMEKGHQAFGDTTAGGEHIPGGAGILGIEDGTTIIADGTRKGRGLVWDSSSRLWCSTEAAEATLSGTWTEVLMHPDLQWGSGDVTWAGEQQFDASVAFTEPVEFSAVDISGTLTVDGSADFDGTAVTFDVTAVDILGDLSVNQGFACGSDAAIIGDVSLDAGLAVDGTVRMIGDVSGTPFASAWASWCADGANGDLGAGDFTGYNVNKIFKISTGIYEVSFTNVMPYANYCAIGTADPSGGSNVRSFVCVSKPIDSFRIHVVSGGGSFIDPTRASMVVFA